VSPVAMERASPSATTTRPKSLHPLHRLADPTACARRCRTSCTLGEPDPRHLARRRRRIRTSRAIRFRRRAGAVGFAPYRRPVKWVATRSESMLTITAVARRSTTASSPLTKRARYWRCAPRCLFTGASYFVGRGPGARGIRSTSSFRRRTDIPRRMPQSPRRGLFTNTSHMRPLRGAGRPERRISPNG